jgi:uncharacterized protein involved in high-affinity Fe2+ transport
MFRRWAAPLITVLIVGGVALVVVMNLNFDGASHSKSQPNEPAPVARPTLDSAKPMGFREYPIGLPQMKNSLKIAAVWLPPIQMDGMGGPASSDLIHLEADIHATEGNPNGFALDEFVPYLQIHYQVVSADGGKPIQDGVLMPMAARDGLHYGANIAMPKAGSYTLILDIDPPSKNGLGRHSDSATGVADWWTPFQVRFDWDYPGPPAP